MSTLLFGLLALPVYLLMLWPLVVASRRVLGVRIRTVRALLGALAGWLVVGQAVGWLFPNFHESPGLFAGLLIPIAGCAFLATLTFLFLAEMAFPSGGGLGFVGRLRSLRRRAARGRRYSQVSRIAVKHGIGHYLVGRRGADGTRQAVLARSLRRALEDAGVTFVKLGQVLSTRPDLLPPAFIDELSRLQDQVAPVPFEKVERELVEELGRPLAETFAELAERTIGTRPATGLSEPARRGRGAVARGVRAGTVGGGVGRAGVSGTAAQWRRRGGQGSPAGYRPGGGAGPRHRLPVRAVA